MSDDWRIDNAQHLKGLTLHFRQWKSSRPDWDHDHCAACSAKLAGFDAPDVRRSGYATGDDYPKGAGYDWVCSDCFRDLKEVMGWTASGLPDAS
jgi:hypothetical protein